LRGTGRSDISVKNSRFIGIAQRVEGRDGVERFFKEVFGMHPKADHHATAFIIGRDGLEYGSSDGGEPSGSAGAPILDVLERGGMVDVAIVVTRYFGGTRLGFGGLCRAYSKAAKLAVEDGGKAELHPFFEIIISGDHETMAKLENDLKAENKTPIRRDYGQGASLAYLVKKEELDPLRAMITQKFGIDIIFEIAKEISIPI